MTYDGLVRIFGGKYIRNEPLKKYTSFKTGGNAEALVLVTNENDFISGIKYVREKGIRHYVFGNCSNVLISDSGLNGVVFIMTPEFSGYTVCGDIIEAQSGILLSSLSKIACENSLCGLEFASGIPGTLGGAVAINAGAYGGQMRDVVTGTRYLDEDSQIRPAEWTEHDFGYRHSMFSDSEKYILSSVLCLKKGDKDRIAGLMQELRARRREKQPLSMPSAGSVFKRPADCYTGKLIQDAGLMGCRIGGAEVSTVHAGWIVNAGDATSSDIYRLICHVKKEVFRIYSVELETEIKIYGDF